MSVHDDRLTLIAIAPAVLMGRLSRCNDIGTVGKGRMLVEFVGEPTDAERLFDAIRSRYIPVVPP